MAETRAEKKRAKRKAKKAAKQRAGKLRVLTVSKKEAEKIEAGRRAFHQDVAATLGAPAPKK